MYIGESLSSCLRFSCFKCNILIPQGNITINVDLNNRKLRKNTRQKPILDKSTKHKVDELYYNPRVRNNNYTQYSIHELINCSTNKPHTIKRNNLKPTKTPQTVTTNKISQSIQSKGKLVQINDINNNKATKKTLQLQNLKVNSKVQSTTTLCMIPK